MGEIEAMLKNYAAKKRIGFSMPGHKQRGGAWFLNDVTELPDTDNLHHSRGAVRRAEKSIAAAYSCCDSLIMVNGSTGGIFAMISAVLKRGQKLLVSRICHMSVINACIALGIEPVFFEHEFFPKYSIYGGADISDLKRKLAGNSVSAVMLTSPNYFGITSDIHAVKEAVGALPLLVDSAHGAHFFAGDFLPENAARYADIAVQSTHKTLRGLNQSALLHINKGKVDPARVRDAAAFFQTSSPSYIIAASAENAVLDVLNNPLSWRSCYDECVKIKAYLRENTRLLMPAASDGFYELDETRLVFNFSQYNISAKKAAERLYTEYNTDVEMAEGDNLVLIATPGNSSDDFKALSSALVSICSSCEPSCGSCSSPLPPAAEGCEITPSEAFYSEHEYLPTAESVGRISAGTVAAYPPGVPICVPGEKITPECVRYITECGGEIIGLYDGKIKLVKERTV